MKEKYWISEGKAIFTETLYNFLSLKLDPIE